MTHRLVTLSPGEGTQLTALHAEGFEHEWPAQDFDRLLGEAGTLGLGYARTWRDRSPAGQLEAFLIVQRVIDQADLLTLAVARHARRQGLARRLVETTADRLARLGVRRFLLDVAADNQPARALYAGIGFREDGVRKRYYQRANGETVDALLLSRDLVSPMVASGLTGQLDASRNHDPA